MHGQSTPFLLSLLVAAAGTARASEPSFNTAVVSIQEEKKPAAASQDQSVSIGLAPEESRLRATDLFRKAASGQEQAREEWRQLKPPLKVLALQRILAHAQAPLRQSALQEIRNLSQEDDPGGKILPALVQASLRDTEEPVRQGAWQEVLRRNDARTPRLLARRLDASDPDERKRAVAGLKALGGPRVFEALVERWRETWGPGPRGYMLVAKQRSYIADYDISGDAYDPVIRQFLEGVVLDVKPLLAYADIYILKALREVSGQDFGTDRQAWERWLKEEKLRPAEKAARLPEEKVPAEIPAEVRGK